MRRLRALGAISASLLITAAVAGLLLVVLSRSGPPRSALPRPPLKSAASLPFALQIAFPIFRRPRTADDVVPAELLNRNLAQLQNNAGVQPGLSRLVTSNPVATQWVIPGSQRICTITRYKPTLNPTPAVDCTNINWSLRIGMITVRSFGAFGVLPAGARNLSVTQAGQTHRASLGPLGIVAIPGESVDYVRYTAPDGTPIRILTP